MEEIEVGENLSVVTGSKYIEPEVLGDREVQTDLVRKRVIELRDAVADSYFELGKHLHYVQREALYAVWGFDSFSDYIDQEVTFAWRKAMYSSALLIATLGYSSTSASRVGRTASASTPSANFSITMASRPMV